jgi:hypothetical protein
MIVDFFIPGNVLISIIKKTFSKIPTQSFCQFFFVPIALGSLVLEFCTRLNELGINPSLYNVNLNIL